MVGKNPKNLSARERLVRAGCLDPVEVGTHSLPVHFDQLDSLGENRLFRVTNLITGCCVSIRCLTDEASTPIHGVRLELQLPGFEFRWLEDSEGDQKNYRCSLDYQFPRDQVINSKFPGVLYRGNVWQGWLIGVSYKAMPSSLRGVVAGIVKLYDAFGRTASGEVSLLVDPTMPKKTPSKRRSGLFEMDEVNSEKPIGENPRI